MNISATQSIRKLGNSYFLLKNKSVTPFHIQTCSISFLWNWLNTIFNSVDNQRLKLVGPDFTCAEWLLRNGATVRFKGYPNFVTDYNELISMETFPEAKSTFKIEEIFAKKASISHYGFPHLKDCNHINKITFIFCNYINNEALYNLKYVSDSARYLELRSCFNVTDKGILSLAHLRNLKELTLANLVSVKDGDKCVSVLKESLVNCKINFEK